mmetsp:Transcript_3429/g.6009  ORF Transcript_3429/g.6009 Transcript_3429/m.6009 type:complete len:472 (-) Transcript_3429:2288-3703(-)
MDAMDSSNGGDAVYQMDAEFVKSVDEIVSKSSTASLDSSLEELLALERTQRLAANAPECAYVCVEMIKLCYAAKNWSKLSETIVLLSKRRAQLKQAVTKMVQQALLYIDETPDKASKIAYIEMLREVSAGKIYVELEEARLTRMLSDIYEKDGDIEAAAKIMQDLQVETYGSMERREKTDFILEQIRLCLIRSDYIRAGIIAKKITPRSILHEDLADIRLRYYSVMAEIQAHNSEMLEICRSCLARFEALQTTADSDQTEESMAACLKELRIVVLFLALSEYGTMQQDLFHRISSLKKLSQLPVFSDLLKLMMTPEIVRWAVFKERFSGELSSAYAEFEKTMINKKDSASKLDWESIVRERVTEHNLRIVSTYYERIRLDKLAKLLDLSPDTAKERVAHLVSDKKVLWAKIDRPKGIVVFRKNQAADENLNEWAKSVSSLLDLVEKTCHLVHKEIVVHGANSTAENTAVNS